MALIIIYILSHASAGLARLPMLAHQLAVLVIAFVCCQKWVAL